MVRVAALPNIYNGTGNLTSVNVAESRYNFDMTNYSGNLNFRHIIDTAGTEITGDFDLIRYITCISQTS